MQVVHDALKGSDLPRGCITTIGNYDGIHLGQRTVLDLVAARAREVDLPSVVVTFDPHPLSVLRPEMAPEVLTTLSQKEALIDEIGIDFVLIVRFTHEFSQMPARSFVRDFLHERLDVQEIYVGTGFGFGNRREGDLSLLRQMGESFGFGAFAVDEVRIAGERVSSTRIRELIREGKVQEAAKLLGREYAVTGLIARGDRMGLRLGWPTINLAPDNDLLPADGVYTSRVHFPSFPSTFDSVTNVGTRPTVYENYERVAESHILDFSGDVYGESVALRFYKRLRDERMFQSTVDLSAQIARDVETTREYFRARRRFEESTVSE